MSNVLQERLARLAEVDPISAEQVRSYLADDSERSCIMTPAYDDCRAREWLEQEAKEGEPDLVLVIGAGSSYSWLPLMEQLPPETKLVLLEMDVARAAELVRAHPLEEWVHAGRVVPAFGALEDYVASRVASVIHMPEEQRICLYDTDAMDEKSVKFYEKLLLKVREDVHLTVFNIGTLIDRGALWQFNTITNIPELIRNPGVASLAGVFEGKPALVVGAGPSLNRILPLLPMLADRFVILSTGTALRPLREVGVRPDLVVAVDGSHKTGPQFETDCDDLYLASSALVFPPILKKFRGLFSGSIVSNPISQWINEFGESKGSLVAAGTVTASAVDLAVTMGCDPVVTIGFDLSFCEDGTTHADGTMYDGHRVEERRLVPVPGNYRDEVYTTEQFRCYILLMQHYIESRPNTRFYNVTDSGARIEGMTLAGLDELAGLAAPEPLAAYETIQQRHAAYADTVTAEVRRELLDVRDHLNALGGDMCRAAMICNQLIMLLRAPQAGDEETARKKLEELDEIDRHVESVKEHSIFLNMSLWPAGYALKTRRQQHEVNYTDAVMVNRRAREMYEQIAGAAAWTRDLLDAVIKRIPDQTPKETFIDNESTPSSRCSGEPAASCLALEEVP
jgi:hypothetical protein